MEFRKSLSNFLDEPLSLSRLARTAGVLIVFAVVAEGLFRFLPDPSSFFGFIKTSGLTPVPFKRLSFDLGVFANIAAACLFAIALPALPLAFLLRRRALQQSLSDTGTRGCRQVKKHQLWFAALLYTIAFGATVAVLKTIDVSWQHFDRTGQVIVAYTMCRLLLACSVLAACVTVGCTLLAFIAPSYRMQARGSMALFIDSFFLGATAYGVAATAIGFAGLLTTSAALVLIVPAIFASPFLLREFAQCFFGWTMNATGRQDRLGFTVSYLLAWGMFCSAAYLLVTKGLYPAVVDGDVWVHYLHYYRDVLRTGSLVSYDLWYDLFQSKGIGLAFLFGLVSDSFSIQLVSWCFVVVAALIVFDLVGRSTKSHKWACASTTAFLASFAPVAVNGDLTASFFKIHEIAAGLLAYVGWSSIRLLDERQEAKPPLSIPLFVCAYLSFLIPIITSVIAVSFTSIGLVRRLGRHTLSARAMFLLAAASIIGTSLSYVVNYVSTGLVDIVPFQLLWRFADQERFIDRFGSSGILYFLLYESDLHRIGLLDALKLDLERSSHLVRYDFLHFFLPRSLVIVSIAILVARVIRRGPKKQLVLPEATLLAAACFLISSMLLSQLIHNPSLYRLYVFSTFFTVTSAAILGQIAFESLHSAKAKQWLVAVFLITTSLTAMSYAIRDTSFHRLRSIIAYTLGKASVADTLREVSLSYPEIKAGPQIELTPVVAMRKLVGPDARILTFAAGSAPAFAFPGVGLVSEPSYSMGPRHLDIVYGRPELAKAILQNLGINYFHINLRHNLFTNVAFSNLFRPDVVGRFLKVEFQDRDDYLLTWRTPDDSEPLPELLVQMLDLKRAAGVYLPFSKQFEADLHELIGRWLHELDGEVGLGRASTSDLTRATDGLTTTLERHLIRNMTGDMYSKKGQEFVNAIIQRVSYQLEKELPDIVGRHWAASAISPDPNWREQLRAALDTDVLNIVRSTAARECADNLRRDLCYILTSRSERQQFSYGETMERKDVEALLKKTQRR